MDGVAKPCGEIAGTPTGTPKNGGRTRGSGQWCSVVKHVKHAARAESAIREDVELVLRSAMRWKRCGRFPAGARLRLSGKVLS